ncbi:MAG: bifunctional riboflavin kinase/FAD synthetase [Gammaproteobacteria bacterium]|nr:bifunctional riboflavin kinase/FAD synthetase [Gammaproteobacteria bacterium]MBU1558525.1 bifunctional riboflavin kinase/FAD synthetase [Gammaproteobacteria bacterium]MBU1926961.1 bifunctional riboflavin kinase/FAD synthetase [Gammaproteobacteria bacterium]MBU2546607.1 bifunctional riboflavin kinase/FAD synthetase [Gammaproteobacteria bacterium]
MQIIRGLCNLKSDFPNSVVTIGNFDGVHRGHQMILEHVEHLAQAKHLRSVVITFEPQPEEFFQQDCPARLTRFREKWQRLSQYKIDDLLVVRFNTRMANLSAEMFLEDLLIRKLHVQYLVIGDDFHFGQKRIGNFAYLERMSKKYGFEVESFQALKLHDERISSTRIRLLLAQGEMDAAAELLGHSYSMWGRVIHGQELGRNLGFPTANVYLHRYKTPLLGVYAVLINGLQKMAIPGIANIGTRPTANGNTLLLEVHLFDFDQQIYGKMIQITFIKKIREEKTFESFSALKNQVQNDIQQVKQFFSAIPAKAKNPD